MPDSKRTRRRLPALMLISMLGIAVFLWGLHYKLSLYQAHLALHNAPAAKLLSQKERPSCGLMTSKLLPVHPPPRVRTRAQSGASPARLTSAGIYLASRGRTLLLAPTLRPEALQGRYVTPSSPRAPPVAV